MLLFCRAVQVRYDELGDQHAGAARRPWALDVFSAFAW
jgi:hypothetical protein